MRPLVDIMDVDISNSPVSVDSCKKRVGIPTFLRRYPHGLFEMSQTG